MTVQGQIASDFSSEQTKEIVGITYRQLDHWTRMGLVTATAQQATGSGSRRRYSYRDLLELKLIKRLLDEGIVLQKIRKVFNFVRDELGEDLASADLVIQGNKSLLVRTEEQLLDALRQGQGAFYLPMDELVQQVQAAVRELPVETDAQQQRRYAGPALEQPEAVVEHPISQTGS